MNLINCILDLTDFLDEVNDALKIEVCLMAGFDPEDILD